MKRKILMVFGTRPEAIKMCPLIKEFRMRGRVQVRVCVSGQHREMLDEVLELFGVEPEYDLNIMRQGQTLFDITSRILTGMDGVLSEYAPDLVFVHGDTTTAFASALACLYHRIPVAHVEAGLRTHDIYSPFPEEFNRQAVALVARYHFAPTEAARDNLIREGRRADSIYVTGNTGIDALRSIVMPDYSSGLTDWAMGSRLILVTAHRRENLGEPMRRIFRAVRRVAERYPDVRVICPLHPNPAVRRTAGDILEGCGNIRLIEPLGVFDFQNLMNRAHLILTDSGGIQEEAPALGKPVLVLRDTTERPEGVGAGALMLVGTDEEAVFSGCCALLEDEQLYSSMSRAHNPYGDGRAAGRIADIIERDYAQPAVQ